MILETKKGHILKALAPSPSAPEREVIDASKLSTGKRFYWKANIDFGYETRRRRNRQEREGSKEMINVNSVMYLLTLQSLSGWCTTEKTSFTLSFNYLPTAKVFLHPLSFSFLLLLFLFV